MVNLEQLKIYLGIDGEEQTLLLASFLKTAKHIVEKVLRAELDGIEYKPIIDTAIEYICWQLYFHRDGGDLKMPEIEKTVAIMLSDLREDRF